MTFEYIPYKMCNFTDTYQCKTNTECATCPIYIDMQFTKHLKSRKLEMNDIIADDIFMRKFYELFGVNVEDKEDES